MHTWSKHLPKYMCTKMFQIVWTCLRIVFTRAAYSVKLWLILMWKMFAFCLFSGSLSYIINHGILWWRFYLVVTKSYSVSCLYSITYFFFLFLQYFSPLVVTERARLVNSPSAFREKATTAAPRRAGMMDTAGVPPLRTMTVTSPMAFALKLVGVFLCSLICPVYVTPILNNLKLYKTL